jgi:hypothetical protein
LRSSSHYHSNKKQTENLSNNAYHTSKKQTQNLSTRAKQIRNNPFLKTKKLSKPWGERELDGNGENINFSYSPVTPKSAVKTFSNSGSVPVYENQNSGYGEKTLEKLVESQFKKVTGYSYKRESTPGQVLSNYGSYHFQNNPPFSKPTSDS